MAAIKSTLEKVLERAARMEQEAAASADGSARVEEGMRLAAASMRGEAVDLNPGGDASDPDGRFLRQGIVDGLLRNIFLPRDEHHLQISEQAMTALQSALPGRNDLEQNFSEMKMILTRYREHREQLRQQLHNAFSQQIEQLEKVMAKQTGVAMKVSPEQHPKYQEEWQRIQTQLDDQYGRAIEQHKDFIRQRAGS